MHILLARKRKILPIKKEEEKNKAFKEIKKKKIESQEFIILFGERVSIFRSLNMAGR